MNYFFRSAFFSFLRLSWRLALAELKLRNEGSYLGNIWYLLNPLLLFSVLYFVFVDRLGNDISLYPAYLLTGVLMFNYFVRITHDATGIVRNSQFIKSLSFNREALVLSVVFKHGIAHMFEATVFFTLLWFIGVPLYAVVVYFLVAVLVSFCAYGVSLMLAMLTMYIADVGNVWQFFTMLLWFLTPIFYRLEEQESLVHLNQINPLYYFITLMREMALYTHIPSFSIFIGALLSAFVPFVLGRVFFRRFQYRFAELI